MYDCIDRLLSAHPIKFFKWDFNRNFSEPGFPSAPLEEQREIWVRHALGDYEIAEKLKLKHPAVIFQSCSGGVGRVDMGILQYFDQVWVSDNTDARLIGYEFKKGFLMRIAPTLWKHGFLMK